MLEVLLPVVVVCLIGVAVFFAWRSAQKRATQGSTAAASEAKTALALEENPQMVVYPTGRSDQVLVVTNDDDDASGIGTELARIPAQITQRLVRLTPLVRGGTDYAQATGRLVMVNKEFAEAMRAGRVARDASGVILPMGRDAAGHFSQLARIRDIGNVTQFASVAGTVSAMATQAQLARLEVALSKVTEQLTEAANLAQIQHDARRTGRFVVVQRVYRTATAAGTLTEANWSLVRGEAGVLVEMLQEDRSRLAVAVSSLTALANQRSARSRDHGVAGAFDHVAERQQAFAQSARTWLQFSILNIWYLNVIGDATLDSYQRELEAELEAWKELEPLKETALAALQAMERLRLTQKASHPLRAHALPKTVKAARAQLNDLPWDLLSGEQP